MKKAIACILAFMLVFGTVSVSAIQNNNTIQPALDAVLNSEDNTVDVNISVDEENNGKKILLRVYQKVDQPDSQNDVPTLVWAEEGRINESGAESFSIKVENYISAQYLFIATIENTTIVCEDTIEIENITDEPGTDEPGTDEPGTDEPGTGEPGTDEPGTGEPGTEDNSSLNVELDLHNNTTKATLLVDTKNVKKSVLLRIFKEDIQETETVSVPMLIWAEEGRVKADGKVSFDVNLNNYDTAQYHFVCTVENTAIKCEDSIVFYSIEEKNNLWTQIENAFKTSDKTVLEWIVDNRGDYLNLKVDEYTLLKNKEFDDEFLSSVLLNKCVSLDDFVNKFNQTVLIAKLYDCEQSEIESIIETIINELSLSMRTYDIYSDSDEIAQVVRTQIFDNSKSLSVDNFDDYFNSAVVLKLLSNEKQLWTGYENVLRIYSSEAALNWDDYNDVDDKQSVIEDLIDAHDTFVLLSSLKEKFDSLVTIKLESESQGNGGTGDGGSSSSGSSSAGKPSSVILPNNMESQPSGTTDSQDGSVTIPSRTRFSDTGTSAWAEEAIEYLAERGIISGTGNGKFEPEKPITRAEIVKLLVVAFGVEIGKTENVFDDVTSTAWYAPYVSSAFKAGLVNGVSDRNFAPNAYVSRQDIAVMINRINNVNVGEYNLSFSDSSEISDYAQESVKTLVSLGILNGMGNNNFAPKENCTRAQAAKILFEMIKTGV